VPRAKKGGGIVRCLICYRFIGLPCNASFTYDPAMAAGDGEIPISGEIKRSGRHENDKGQ
jgi:hypothetical protein